MHSSLCGEMKAPPPPLPPRLPPRTPSAQPTTSPKSPPPVSNTNHDTGANDGGEVTAPILGGDEASADGGGGGGGGGWRAKKAGKAASAAMGNAFRRASSMSSKALSAMRKDRDTDEDDVSKLGGRKTLTAEETEAIRAHMIRESMSMQLPPRLSELGVAPDEGAEAEAWPRPPNDEETNDSLMVSQISGASEPVITTYSPPPYRTPALRRWRTPMGRIRTSPLRLVAPT